MHILVGVEESEWLRQWEDRILQAVRLRIKAPLEGYALEPPEEERPWERPEMCEV